MYVTRSLASRTAEPVARRWADRDRAFGLCLWLSSSKLVRQCQDRESTPRCQTWPRPLSLVQAFHKHDGYTISAYLLCARHFKIDTDMPSHLVLIVTTREEGSIIPTVSEKTGVVSHS